MAFADASLGDVLEASAVHAYYYDTVPWYDELVHYQTLLGPGRTPWAARVPILITLGLMLLVAAGSGRRGPEDDALRRVLLHAAATTAAGLRPRRGEPDQVGAALPGHRRLGHRAASRWRCCAVRCRATTGRWPPPAASPCWSSRRR